MIPFVRNLNTVFDRIPNDVVALLLRLIPAVVFWQSGRTKVEGTFSIADSTWFLFEHEYALPVIPSEWAAVLATVAEHVLPILLILGLFTRFAAFGLLIMTLVIQVFVYPDAWIVHGLWAATLLALMARGPGMISADRWLGFDGAGSASSTLAPAQAR